MALLLVNHVLSSYLLLPITGLHHLRLYFDFAKAFDLVSHSRLPIKLEAYGITGKVLA